MGRYNEHQIRSFIQEVLADGFCMLPGHFAREVLEKWNADFGPLLHKHIAREGSNPNRGTRRYYVTLPFTHPFDDPLIYDDDDLIGIVRGLVGDDAVMSQLASDTPVLGSDYQEVHRDAPPLFPETGEETLPFQLAVNFPLVDITPEMGPVEVARGTHMLIKTEALRRLESGEAKLEALTMRLGDVMIRDVRGLHRGTPNRTAVPRPMVVLGYGRRWLYRPEVSIRIPRAAVSGLSDRARFLLRFNPIVDRLDENADAEIYQSFAY